MTLNELRRSVRARAEIPKYVVSFDEQPRTVVGFNPRIREFYANVSNDPIFGSGKDDPDVKALKEYYAEERAAVGPRPLKYHAAAEEPPDHRTPEEKLECPQCGRHNPTVKGLTARCWWCEASWQLEPRWDGEGPQEATQDPGDRTTLPLPFNPFAPPVGWDD